jgi:hypothetical protein
MRDRDPTRRRWGGRPFGVVYFGTTIWTSTPTCRQLVRLRHPDARLDATETRVWQCRPRARGHFGDRGVLTGAAAVTVLVVSIVGLPERAAIAMDDGFYKADDGRCPQR